MNQPLRRALFALGALPDQSFEGYTDGTLRNSHAKPLFTLTQARRLVEAWRGQGREAEYIQEEDAFQFSVGQDPETGAAMQFQSFAGIESGGERLYPVGDGWEWKEVQK